MEKLQGHFIDLEIITVKNDKKIYCKILMSKF